MWQHKIPVSLIYSRLLIGLVILLLSFLQPEGYRIYAISLFVIGLLTDIFDGIIARKMNISSQKLRRMDSSVDQVFYLCFAAATYMQCPEFFKNHILMIGLLLAIEALTYLVSFIKFRKEIATHSIAAKIWSLFLFATLVEVIWTCESSILFGISIWFGILSRLEIIAIILILKEWTNDVPSFYHAIKIRKGMAIKRNKLFNG